MYFKGHIIREVLIRGKIPTVPVVALKLAAVDHEPLGALEVQRT
jgi:hypothetical protein